MDKLFFARLSLRPGEFAGNMPCEANDSMLLPFIMRFGRERVVERDYGRSLSLSDEKGNRILVVKAADEISAARFIQDRYKQRGLPVAWYFGEFKYPKSQLWNHLDDTIA